MITFDKFIGFIRLLILIKIRSLRKTEYSSGLTGLSLLGQISPKWVTRPQTSGW